MWPLTEYTGVVLSGVAIGFLAFAVWAHHMFATGMPEASLVFFSGDTFMISAPTGVLFFAWLATMWKGRLRFKTPMLFALGFVVMFLIGGLDGVHLAVVPVDWQLTDTYYVIAHIHYVLFGGAIFGLIGLAGVVVLGLLMTRMAIPSFRQLDPHFFFLGAAFFLLETKSITELALLFGSTWIVNAAVIAAILFVTPRHSGDNNVLFDKFSNRTIMQLRSAFVG